MFHKPSMNKTLLALAIGSLGYPFAASAGNFLPLVQYPAGTSSKEPAPNVIISVDNSGSMGVGGMNALKNALKATFTPTNVPDDAIRLAYQAMWDCNTIPSAHISCGGHNAMKTLRGLDNPADNSHRGHFISWVNTLGPLWNTPTHQMMKNAGEYLKSTGINSPWNQDPGTTQNPVQTCRRAYHVLMTDGGWNNNPTNNINNDDGTNQIFPDGTSYDITADVTRVYRDAWGDTNVSTLSDMAFYYWRNDLQPGINNAVVPLIKKSGPETFADGGTSVTIPQYWNPKNDPATWQHMVTYTIGYNNAATWPNINSNPMFNVAQKMYGGDFAKAMVGTKLWRDPLNTNESGRQEELWHMAINSRGKFFPAQTDQDLIDAFKEIIGTIIADSSRPITGFASTAASVKNAGTTAFYSTYEPDGWKGGIASWTVAASTAALTANSAWGMTTVAPIRGRTTGDILDTLTNADMGNRLILSYNDSTNAGVSFTWSTLSPAQQTLLNTLNSVPDTKGADRVDFIRGDRSKEGTTTSAPFRVRKSRGGDIVNSTLWYVGRPIQTYAYEQYRTFAATQRYRMPMIYVGSNDGMLHGFSAADGTEKMAYVPRGVIKNLPLLTDSNFDTTHQYFVDGAPMTGDVNIGTTALPDWRTMLVSSLGAGGKGYFVLDVTRPGYTAGAETSNFTAANAANLVVMDRTDGADADIGHIFGDPVAQEGNPQISTQIARMNNGRWAVVMGNGPNSTNEDPVLLIQYLDGDKALVKINAASTGTEASGNGLGTPRLVDLNGDGSPDVIYAGDLRGNLWKFNVAHADATQWGVAFSSANCTACTPFYTAVESANTATRQPITAAPMVRENTDVKGMMVAFGTGRNMTEGDRTDVSVQTFYSMLDNTRYKLDTAVGINKGKVLIDTVVTPAAVGTNQRSTKLLQRTFNGSTIAGQGSSTGDSFWRMDNSQTPVNYTTHKGWYFELPVSGERVITHPEFYDGSDVIEIHSLVPGSGGNTVGETCEPSSTPARGYITLLGIQQGQRPTQQLLDADGDGVYNAAAAKDNDTNRTTSDPKGLRINARGKRILIGNQGNTTESAHLLKPAATINWRQLR